MALRGQIEQRVNLVDECRRVDALEDHTVGAGRAGRADFIGIADLRGQDNDQHIGQRLFHRLADQHVEMRDARNTQNHDVRIGRGRVGHSVDHTSECAHDGKGRIGAEPRPQRSIHDRVFADQRDSNGAGWDRCAQTHGRQNTAIRQRQAVQNHLNRG